MGGSPRLFSPTAGEHKGRVASGPGWPSPLSTYVEVWLAMRGTDYALLDQLGRLTGGVAVDVLRPQGTPATFPDLPSFVSDFQGSSTTLRLPKRTGAGQSPQSLSVRSEE